MIRTLRAGGLPDQVIAYACDLLPLYVTAVAYEEGLYASENVTPEVMLEFNVRMREFYASVPPERFPNVVALAPAPLRGHRRRTVRVRARGARPRARRDGGVSAGPGHHQASWRSITPYPSISSPRPPGSEPANVPNGWT